MQESLGLLPPKSAFSGRWRHRSKRSSLYLFPISAFRQLAHALQPVLPTSAARLRASRHLSPMGLGDGDECLGYWRRTRHASIIFPYGNISSQDLVARTGDVHCMTASQ
jgi:hypothetical protein